MRDTKGPIHCMTCDDRGGILACPDCQRIADSSVRRSMRTPGPWAREFRVRPQAAQDDMPETFAVSFLHPNGDFVDVGYADTRAEAVAMRDRYQLDEATLFATVVAPANKPTVIECCGKNSGCPYLSACNSHDTLTAQNKALREALESFVELCEPRDEYPNAVRDALAALALGGGE